MNLSAESRERIQRYLDDVAARLPARSDAARRELLCDLETHIHEALRAACGAGDPTPEQIETVLAGMDAPEQFGAEAAPPPDMPPAAGGSAAPPRGGGRWFALACAFLVLNGWAVWHWSQGRSRAVVAAGAQVAAFSADDNAVVSDRQPLAWEFSADMAPDSAGASPVRVSPPVPGRCAWESARRLAFTPDMPWPAARTYEVALSDRLRTADGRELAGEHVFRVQTEPLKVTAVTQVALKPDRELVLALSFNAPVHAADLERHVSLASNDRRIGFHAAGPAVSTNLLIETAPVMHEKLRLSIREGLPPADGTLPMREGFATDLAVIEGFALRRIHARSPSFEPCAIDVYFSEAVEINGAAGCLAVQPPAKFTVSPLYTWQGGGVTLSGEFQPGTPYALTIRPGLTSVNGRRIEKPIVRHVQLPNRTPALAVAAGGRYLSPGGSLRVPVSTMNVRECRVAARRVLPQNLVFLAMRETGNYASTYANQPREIADHLTGASRGRTYELADRPNAEQTLSVHLRELAGDDPHGVFLLSAEAKDLSPSDRLVVVTDLGLAARRARDGVWAWVNRLRTAEPAAGADVALYGMNNAEMARARAGSDGLAFLPVPPGSTNTAPFLVTAAAGGDRSFLVLGPDTSVAHPESATGRPYLDGPCEAYVFTDRGIYRPGETAHVKSLVRDAGLRPPEPFPVLLRVRRPDGRMFKDFPGMLDGVGATECAVTLPDYLPTGAYRLELALPGTFKPLGATSIAMEDFVPPQIAVRLEEPPARASAAAPIDFHVAARHLFGRAAGGLAVNGRAYFTAVPFKPAGWEGWRFGDETRRFSPVFVELGRNALDDDGRASFRAEPSASWRPPAAVRADLGATVVETSGRAVSATAEMTIDVYPHYIGLRPAVEGGHVRAGETQRVAVALVSPDGKAIQPENPLQFTLARVQWTTVLRRNSDGSYSYQSESHATTEQEGKIRLADGRGEAAVCAERAGEYLLSVNDPFTAAASSLRLFSAAAGQEWVDWAKDKPETVALSLDRERYAPGDRARLAIKAPFAGAALLSVESDRVLTTRVVRLERNTAEVEIEVRPEWSPNVYCSVVLIRPAVAESVWTAHRAAGAVPLRVVPPDREIKMSLEAPGTVRPRTRLAAKLRLADAEGRPVAGDAVVAAVDEGICALTDFATPSPLKYFLGQRALGVEWFDLYSALMPEIEAEAAGASHAPGGAGALLRRRLNPIRANRFKPVALWATAVRAGTNGEAEVVFDVPEFTGELRLMAVAWTAERLGSGQCAVKVRRPLVVQPALPRFLAPDDECVLGLSIFNDTGADRDVQVTVTCGGPLQAGEAARTVRMKSGGSENLAIPLRAGRVPGKAVCAISVEAGEERYSESIELAVRPAVAPVSRASSGAVEGGASAILTAPTNWLAETVHFDLWASAQPDVKLKGALDYLLHYPYGCLEQTASQGFPLLYLADLANRLHAQSMGEEETAPLVQAAVWRVLSMQQTGGGFSPWPYSTLNAGWTGIYATHFLVEARKAGVPMPPDRLEAALVALRNRLDMAPPMDADPSRDPWQDDMEERAYACHVLALAGQPEHGWAGRLREVAPRLRAGARAHLAAALMLGGRPREGAPLLEGLGLADAPAPTRRLGACLNSPVRDAALALSAWLDIDPRAASVPLLVKRLESLQVDGTWFTTQDNAAALVALGKFARLVPADRTPFRGRLVAAGQPAVEFSETKELRWSSKEPGSVAALTIENAGPGRCFYGARVEGVPADGTAAEEDRGFSVRREWLDVKGRPWPTNVFAQGDMVIVRLTVDTGGRSLDNLVLTDLLPAGLEIENARLATAQVVPWIDEKSAWCVHRDARDDRLLLFSGAVTGRAVFYYAARAVTPGRFVVPAVMAEAMYDPAIRSVNGRGSVEVRP